MDNSCKVIALTGGPCGGKTSCLSILSDLFQSLGWKVFRVPETATILLSGGVHFSELNPAQAFSFQKDLLKTMISIEDTFINLAQLYSQNGKKAVVICDRGAMDPSAYVDRESWLRMLTELKLDEIDIRDHRYDCVVHLVSASKGAEAFYSTESNSIRSEGLELARRLDSLVMNAWVGHASLQVVDNSIGNFAQKCDRVVQAVLTRLGLVADNTVYGKLVRKHKFIVNNLIINNEFPVPYKDFKVEHIYLTNSRNDGTQIRLRRREEASSRSVHLNMTMRHPEQDGQRVETRRNLTFREYEALHAQSDPSRSPIIKHRRCFLYNDRYFQIDYYHQPMNGLVLLEAYLDYDGNSGVEMKDLLPSWLDLTEVTNDKNYSMYTIAAKNDK